jgi:hypothetical protein
MSKELIVSVTPQETKAAILENDQVIEIHIERDKEHGVVGAICKGRVMKVLPGMQSAFVDIGLERDAFLYVSDFFEDADEYDKLVSTAEEQVEKLGQPASAALSPAAAGPTSVTEGTVVPSGSNRFQDRRGRSRRSRRFRLKGKHYEGAAPSSTSASPLAPSTPAPPEVVPPASSSDGNDGPPALSLLPGESLAKYQEPSTEASFESEAGALLAGSEDTDDARDIGAAESSDLPLSAVSMAELDSEEEEEVAEVLAAAEVLSGSFLEAESEGATNSEGLVAEERFEALGTGQTRESFSEPAAPALDEAVAP